MAFLAASGGDRVGLSHRQALARTALRPCRTICANAGQPISDSEPLSAIRWRASDACERTWGAEQLVPYCGVTEVGRPKEGSLFQWLEDGGVRYDILAEVVGSPSITATHNPVDVHYPGGPYQSIDYNDLEKACHTAGRIRVACDLGKFVHMTLPNDHTVGLDPGRPTPETMCAINDEATGLFVDALSHSPLWATSLVVLTEDDPRQGGDHVDYHRTPLVLISPWVKRGYVSKTHIDVPSLHEIFAHVLGLPYRTCKRSTPPSRSTRSRRRRTTPPTTTGRPLGKIIAQSLPPSTERVEPSKVELEHAVLRIEPERLAPHAPRGVALAAAERGEALVDQHRDGAAAPRGERAGIGRQPAVAGRSLAAVAIVEGDRRCGDARASGS